MSTIHFEGCPRAREILAIDLMAHDLIFKLLVIGLGLIPVGLFLFHTFVR
jgi:hypothetical protein